MKKLFIALTMLCLATSFSYAQSGKKTTQTTNSNQKTTTNSNSNSGNTKRLKVSDFHDIHKPEGKGNGKTNPNARGTNKN